MSLGGIKWPLTKLMSDEHSFFVLGEVKIIIECLVQVGLSEIRIRRFVFEVGGVKWPIIFLF